MPKYGVWITHACGHRAHYDFSAQPTSAEVLQRRAEPCLMCPKTAPAAPGLFGPEESTALDPKQKLPELVGSAKQVSWGSDIREKQLKAVERHLTERRRLIAALRDPEKQARAREQLRLALDALGALERRTSAHWWIEGKDLEPAELLTAAAAVEAVEESWLARPMAATSVHDPFA